MTAASPANLEIARAFGGGVLMDATRKGPASYDGDGRRYVFVPPVCDQDTAFALDVEPRGVPAPDPIKTQLQTRDDDQAMRCWTVLETFAKLTDTPIFALLKTLDPQVLPLLGQASGRVDLGVASLCYARCDTKDLWIVVACRAT